MNQTWNRSTVTRVSITEDQRPSHSDKDPPKGK